MADMIFTPVRNELVAVGTGSVLVGQAVTESNPKVVRQFRNTSDADNKIITVHIGEGAAIALTGIVLKRWEAFTDSSGEGYQCWQGRITAICAVAGGQLSIFER